MALYRMKKTMLYDDALSCVGVGECMCTLLVPISKILLSLKVSVLEQIIASLKGDTHVLEHRFIFIDVQIIHISLFVYVP